MSTVVRSLCGLVATVALAISLGAGTLQAWGQDQGTAGTAAEVRRSAPVGHPMVAVANPHAAEAAFAVLEQGGSAVDAALAAQLVLNLVEPQSSGIGGGAFLVHFDNATGAVDAYDGRETAPAAADPGMFLGADGEPMGFYEAAASGLSVGAPGILRMFELAHRDHGRLPWADLFQPAIALAENGFAISPRLAGLIAEDDYLSQMPAARAYFYEADGTPKAAGTVLRNPAFAETLRRIAAAGPDAFYTGDLAAEMAQAVQSAPGHAGHLTVEDLAAYRAVRRDPVCAPYRTWRVCGMPPPTSGGVTVLQMLGILGHFDLPGLPPNGLESAHLIAEAGRLAFADRNRYLADPDFVDVPVGRLLDPAYLARRAALIDPRHDMGTAEPGLREQAGQLGDGRQYEPPSTSHLSILDADGDAVSLTTSVENTFGSRLMVGGFLLNNQLTDFSFRPEIDGRPVANRVEPGKRPRSSMAPTLVFDADGKLRLVVGSPGGSRIIGYTVDAIVAALDWGLDMQAAVALPHVVNRNGATELEEGTALETLAPDLEAMGHEVRIVTMTSGLHGIKIVDGLPQGGADPRREGVVLPR
jgi:gamma-glutamyltranspeptidase/glutathione hydrolase